MFSALLAGALIVGASLVLGAAIMAIAGLPRHSAAGPATGISALLVICGLAVKLPGHAVTAAIAVGVALIGCFAALSRTRAPAGAVRIGALVVVVGTALVAAIPFAASGRVAPLVLALAQARRGDRIALSHANLRRKSPRRRS